MKLYYRGYNQQGEAVNGTAEAAEEHDALRQLDKQGITVTDISQESPERRKYRGKVTQAELLLVLQELTTLLRSGVPLVDAVESQAEAHHNPAVAVNFDDVANALRRGRSFSEAIAESRFPLPDYMLQLIAAGEMTGKLAESLADGVEQMTFERQVSSEIRNALLYPAVLVFSGVAAILLVFAFVVPKFANLLEESADLPFLAYAVLTSGLWVNNNWHLMLVGMVLAAIVAVAGLKQETIRLRLFDSLSRLPLIGTWLVESETGRWSGVLSALLGNGVPIMNALDLANNGVRLRSRRSRLENATQSVKGGMTLAAALKEQNALTATGYNLIRVGEQSGELPGLLMSLSKLYEDSGRNRMKRLLILIEPIAILLIGGVIGTIILGIVLAITASTDVAF